MEDGIAKWSGFSLADVAVRPVRDATERVSAVGPPDGPAPLSGVSRYVRHQPTACRGDAGWSLAGPDRLVCWRLQGRRAGPLDRLGAGAAIPAFAPDREQHAVPDPVTGAGCQSGLVCAVTVVAPVVRRYAVALRLHGTAIGCCWRRPLWTRRALWAPATGRRTGWSWGRRGATRARRAGGWVAHGEPQRIWVYPLTGNTRAELQRGRSTSLGLGQPVGEAPSETRLRSLFGHLREAPEYRSARGIRHSLASVLAITVAAKLVGYRGVTAIGEFAARLDQKQLRAVRAFLSPTSGRRYPPSRSSLHRILSDLDPEVLERAVRDWVAQTGGLDCALALDGKSAPAHRRAGGPAGASMGRRERSRDRRQGPRPVGEAGVRCACSGRQLRGLRGVAGPPPSLSHRARTNRAQDRQDHDGNGIRRHFAEFGHGRAERGAGAGPRALGNREPGPLCARLQL